jgi:hypothetical protein
MICFKVDKNLIFNKENIIFHEAINLFLFREYKILTNVLNNGTIDLFDQGRYYVFKAIITRIIHDPVEGFIDYDETQLLDQTNKDIRKGGELIYSYGPHPSTNNMYNCAIWNFIPKSLKRVVEFTWSGIGTWRA